MLFRAALILIAAAYLPAVAADQRPEASLRIKPRLCIVRSEQELCNIEVFIRWQANTVQPYCLYAQDPDTPLQCWSTEQFGELTDQLRAGKDVPYRLLWNKAEELDRAVLKVVSVVPEDRRRQRGRRHIWSVF